MDRDAWLVFALAVAGGLIYLKFALAAGRTGSCDTPEYTNEMSAKERVRRADDDRERISPWPRYAVALVCLVTAGALLVHVIPSTVAYAFLVLAMVVRSGADLIAEERAPRRRSALLQRSRRIDPTLLAWIALSSLTLLLLVPFGLDQADRAAAIVVAVCVVMMSVVSWRIASAPPILLGNDLEAELIVDRETRANRTGLNCIVTAGTVFVFTGFVGNSPSSAHYRADAVLSAFVVWIALILWKVIYGRLLPRTPLTS